MHLVDKHLALSRTEVYKFPFSMIVALLIYVWVLNPIITTNLAYASTNEEPLSPYLVKARILCARYFVTQVQKLIMSSKHGGDQLV